MSKLNLSVYSFSILEERCNRICRILTVFWHKITVAESSNFFSKMNKEQP
jgi:hypothetical protein